MARHRQEDRFPLHRGVSASDARAVYAFTLALVHRFRTERESQGLVYADIAHRCGVLASVIERVERGDMELTVPMAARLSVAMGARLSDLVRAAEDDARGQGALSWAEQPTDVIDIGDLHEGGNT